MADKHPLVSFLVNSFNRLPLLQNLVRSFELCNEYPNVEWVVSDYGSSDGSREFIENFAKRANFEVRYLFEDQTQYLDSIRKRGLPVDTRARVKGAILGKFRNDLRRLARGEYFVELSDDHQFIRGGDWIEELFEIYRHRESARGHDDISCIVIYGYFRWRLDKPNNARYPQENSDGVPYFVAKQKDYVDYQIMKRQTFERIGEYYDPIRFVPGSPEWRMWTQSDSPVTHETDYQRRCTALGLKRVFMKYPFVVSFPDNGLSLTNGAPDGLIASLWTLDDMKRQFGHLDRLVSSDELDPEHRTPELTQAPSWRNRARSALARIGVVR